MKGAFVGLFGSRKRNNHAAETSVKKEPEIPKQEIDFEQINEEAPVVEREVTPASEPKPEEVQDSSEEYLQLAYIPFKQKPPVTHSIGQTKICFVEMKFYTFILFFIFLQ